MFMGQGHYHVLKSYSLQATPPTHLELTELGLGGSVQLDVCLF